MDSETFVCMEWRIENFSFWRLDAHRRRIEQQDREYGHYVLYPKGPNGLDECMVVHISEVICYEPPCELRYIGPNGSILFKQLVNPKKEKKNLKITNGPKFAEVVSLIRKYGAVFGDSITLQFRSNIRGFKLYMCTEIEVIDISFKIDAEKLERSSSCIKYSHDGQLSLDINATDEKVGKELSFSLSAGRNHSGLSVFTCMSLISSDGSLTRYKESEHLFRSWESWNLPYSLTDGEMKEKAVVSLLLSVKIITGNKIGQDKVVSIYSGRVSIVQNNSACMKDISSKSVDAVSLKPNKTPVYMLSTDLMCLYQDHDFSDFQLKCDNSSFPVHRAILCARSPVFKTLLSNDMKEAASGCMLITDMDVPTLASFLTYLYTGAVEDLQSDRALKLYYAADKYQVPSLRSECAEFLSANISIENLIDVLSTANKHQDDELITLCQNFISNNYGEVLGSEEWKNFMNIEPLIVAKTLTHLAERNVASPKPSA